MREVEHYQGAVITVGPEAPVFEVADQMDRYAVGCVVVVDASHEALGIVTDRDLLRRVVAAGVDPEKVSARDVMSTDLVTGSTDEPLERIVERMRSRGIRRMPILSEGRLAGIVSLDDLVAELGRELGDLREALRGEVLGARRHAGGRRRREEREAALETLRGQVGQLGRQARTRLRAEIDALRERIGRSGS